ncbi:cytochrome C, partial [Bacillus pseudomycoides]|nr:cytochrome C [Bacillus pseudomycoides]
VLLVLVLTRFFIIGFLFACMSKTTSVFSKGDRQTCWIGVWLMTIDTTITAIVIRLNKVTVRYTFYAPLNAHPGFYLGLTL